MRRVAGLMVLLTAAVLSAQDDPTKELTKLNGTWGVSRVESSGNKVPEDAVKGFKLTLTDGDFVSRLGPDEGKGKIKIDPTKKPMTMDILFESGVNKGKTQLAIYELQTGQLKVYAGEVGKDRPTKFDDKTEPGKTLIVFSK